MYSILYAPKLFVSEHKLTLGHVCLVDMNIKMFVHRY